MAPNVEPTETMTPEKTEEFEYEKYPSGPRAEPRKFEIVYFNVFYFGYWHLAALYGVYLCFTSAKCSTIIFHFFVYVLAQIGVTAGAHRLWSHKSFKANRPLEILLMIMHSLAFQNTVIDWVRDHRLHHKYTDTDADPHNPTRGFFFAHFGWVLTRKHPDVTKKGKLIDLSDVLNNPVLMFQKKYAIPLITTVGFILPTVIPMFFWGETFNNAWHLCLLRYVLNLNASFMINSVAHAIGYKPYDTKFLAANSLLTSLFVMGEGFHNYHHTFPWDYRTAELGNNFLNVTTLFIDFFALLGWAYDRKSTPDNLIKARALRTGDGTDLWGFNDKNIMEQKDDMVDDKRED